MRVCTLLGTIAIVSFCNAMANAAGEEAGIHVGNGPQIKPATLKKLSEQLAACNQPERAPDTALIETVAAFILANDAR